MSALLMSALCAICHAHAVIDLSPLKWTVKNANKSIELTTTVPSYALESMRKAGIIADPLHGYAIPHCSLHM